MIRLTDPRRLGPSLKTVRDMLGISRRQLARKIAAITGRDEDSVNAQIWTWDVGTRKPNLDSLVPYLSAIEFDLALAEYPSGPRTWPRLDDPPTDVRRVRSESGVLWERMGEDGYYWTSKGWENGVGWHQVLRWGPVIEVKEETA